MKHTFTTTLFLVFALTTSLISCNKKEEKEEDKKFKVTGKLLTPYNDTIFLSYGSKKDCTIVKNNTFRFEGTLDSIDQGEAYFHLRNTGNYGVVFLDEGDIIVDFDYINKEIEDTNYTFLHTKKVEGSLNHKIWDKYSAFWWKNHEKDNYADLLVQKLKKNIDSFPESPIHGRILDLNSQDLFDIAQIKEIKNVIDTTSMFTWDLINTNTVLNAKIRTQKGTPLQNFKLENTVGKTENFYSPNNKFTIIDFWASWCGPCREENKKLPELAKKYGDKLEIINISLDEDKHKWKEAIEKDGLVWKNYIAGEMEDTISDYYGIVAIPYKLFIDKGGKIMGVNLSYGEIGEILQKE